MRGNAEKIHPHTGEVLRPLWVRPDGRECWPILGASPDDPPTPPAPVDPPTPGDDYRQRFENQQQVNRDLEKKLNETRDASKAQMAEVAKLLGWEQPPADPAALAAQVAEEQGKSTAAQTALADTQRQLAVYKGAAAHAGDPAALLDSASFLASIKDIDPTDDAKLGEAIKAAIAADTRFGAPKGSGTPSFHGGPRTPPTPQSSGTLGGALAGHYASK